MLIMLTRFWKGAFANGGWKGYEKLSFLEGR